MTKKKKNLLLSAILVFMLFACTTKTTENSSSENTPHSDLIVNPEALMQIDVSVEGMTCTGCENTINTSVGDIAGVVDVKSSYQNGVTYVEFDSTQTNIDHISKAITEKGYNVIGYSVHSPSPETEAVSTE